MRLLRRRKKAEGAAEEPAGIEARADGSEDPSAEEAGAEDAMPVGGEAETAGVASASPNGEDAGASAHAGPGDAAVAMADGHEEPAAPATEPAVAAAPPPPVETEDGETRLPPSFYFEGLLKVNERTPSREELDRQAEAEFRAAIAPAVSPLRELAPDASSPEEALQQLTERWGDALPDPEGERLREQDAYKRGPADTAVYYRIRRHFDRPTRHVGFGREGWRAPPGVAREASPGRGRSSRQALPGGQRSRRS